MKALLLALLLCWSVAEQLWALGSGRNVALYFHYTICKSCPALWQSGALDTSTKHSAMNSLHVYPMGTMTYNYTVHIILLHSSLK